MLFFFTNRFILDEMARWWEVPTKDISELEDRYDYAVVFGGMIDSYDETYDRVNFHGGIDRLLQTLPLYHQDRIDKIIITSGSGTISFPEHKEAFILKNYLMDIGYDTTRFVFEGESRNTYENVQYTIKKLQEIDPDYKSKKYLIVTSAYHMRRTMAVLHKAGMEGEPYVTNRKSGPRKFEIDHVLIPDVNCLSTWYQFLHEMVGILVYKVMGYI